VHVGEGSNGEGRLIVVSNRLPVTVRVGHGTPELVPSVGGLATGLGGPHGRTGGLWLGWPGDLSRLTPEAREEVERELAEKRLVPVELTQGEVARYYEGFSNGVLWPLFHYLVDRVPADGSGFGTYRRVNERFAEAAARVYRPGDLVWIHDYQLLLVPRLLRERLPGARIGFFLHIPFPAHEVFRLLPWREPILEGLLGADLVGFHTEAYARHFRESAQRLLGARLEGERLVHRERTAAVEAFPMGIDFGRFDSLGRDPAVIAEAEGLRRGGVKLLVGVDRLDYTKGLPRRMVAFETLLQREPALRGKVRLLQVAVPSREKVEAYREYRRRVDEAVGRINGTFGTASWVPVHTLYRTFGERQLAAMYRAADVMLVTPVRDGMNLVAKEFVATRADGDGVLLLSEFAGAAERLSGAVQVNPYDVPGTAATIAAALGMAEGERRRRMALLREEVRRSNVHAWAETFLARLRATPGSGATVAVPEAVYAAVEGMRPAARRLLLLDYDGTLTPIVSRPELAAPDEALLSLLRRLAATPGNEVHVVSGRRREDLEAFLGELPIALHAEHGLWSRLPGGQWERAAAVSADAGSIRDAFQSAAVALPGSFVEEKSATLAFHYRLARPDRVKAVVERLRRALGPFEEAGQLAVVEGHQVVEARPAGVHKGLVAEAAGQGPVAPAILAVGDDRTDEDLFAALPAGAITVRVGPGASLARFRIDGPAEVRALLERLVE
jgi:trehalose 6-phosphate synthase/phosphatase